MLFLWVCQPNLQSVVDTRAHLDFKYMAVACLLCVCLAKFLQALRTSLVLICSWNKMSAWGQTLPSYKNEVHSNLSVFWNLEKFGKLSTFSLINIDMKLAFKICLHVLACAIHVCVYMYASGACEYSIC